MNASEQEIKGLNLPVNVPVMTQKKFSELSGVELGVLRGWVDKAYIPSVLIGKHRLINVAFMNAKLMIGGEL